MKKILIVNNNMHIGGVQKALVSLLWSIQDRYDVSLLLLCPKGECMKELPPKVKVIAAESAFYYLGMTKHDLQGKKDKLLRGFYAAIARAFGRKYAIWLMSLGQKKLEGFDVAVSYLHDGGEKVFYGGCNDFVLKHVSAKKKIAFLHCDYLLSGGNTSENSKKYAQFDEIAACSQGCAYAFLQANPALKDRVKVVENCHRFDRVEQASLEGVVTLAPDRINVVTVARLGKEKGVERAVQAIAQLGSFQKKLHYWVIGDGVQKALIQELVEKHGLSSRISLLGELSNPYVYMRAADLLLIPSVSEAAPLVIGEAASLRTPVLSTRTSSAKEMISDKGLGWVCENSVEAMAQTLKGLLRKPEQIEKLRETLKEKSFNNDTALEQFERLI